MRSTLFYLWVVCLLFACVCFAPLWDSVPERLYCIMPQNGFYSEKEPAWQTDTVRVLRFTPAEWDTVSRLPRGERIVEYSLPETHTFLADDPLMRCVKQGDRVFCGIPYFVG